MLLVLALAGASLAAADSAAPPAPLAATASAAERRGDREWQQRAHDFEATGQVDLGPAARAVEAYEDAWRARPGDAALRSKLLEALYFDGHFAATDARRARADYDRMVEIAEQAVADAAPGSVTEAESRFWAAIAWGLWGPAHGYLASAARGVPVRIRDHAEALRRIDESYRDAAALRLLGRLHTRLPRVPLVSGWVDRRAGIALLRRACALSLRDARNPLFLAEALLEHEPGSAREAVALLREVAARRPSPDELVEETEIIREAQQVLGTLQTRADISSPTRPVRAR